MSTNNLRHRLDQFHGAILGERSVAEPVSAPDSYLRMADALGGGIVSGAAGSFCLAKTFYTPTYRHGDLTLDETLSVESLPASAFTWRDEPDSIRPESLLMIDTETTGLGGAGAVAFLVGCASVVDNGLQVRQYLIPDYSDEAAMLEVLLTEFGNERTVVSYNGAAFDLPLLRDRMIINRVARRLPFQRHLDLLHPVRRLFRRRLGDCRLVNIERELFGFFREDDIPGYLIPSVYFDWLARQNPKPLAAVMEHNRLDIVSLWFLTVYLVQTFQTEGRLLNSADDLYSLSRIYNRRRDNRRVIDLYQRIDALTPGSPPDDMLLFHAQVFKRAGHWDQAATLWGKLSGASSREGFRANVELAKYYEHRVKDIDRAFHYTRRADNITPPSRRQQQLLIKRLQRLKSKLDRCR
ncbi:MAG: ribonuclease H-like domain-containing protein [bacterium]